MSTFLRKVDITFFHVAVMLQKVTYTFSSSNLGLHDGRNGRFMYKLHEYHEHTKNVSIFRYM